jgi:D-threo-aldose 1-dehydrogenase
MSEGTPSLAPRDLGTTGLKVTPICIGTAVLGNMPQLFYPVEEERALVTLRAFFEGPLNFLDTAAGYSDGESERRIGLVLRELHGLPAGFVLATKIDPDPRTGDYSGDQVRRSLERSLRLLGLERLQLVYLHDVESIPFDYAMTAGGAVETLLRCKEEGLIDHTGVAGGPIDLMSRYVETGAFEVVLTHNRFTLLNVAARRLLALAATAGMAAVNAAPFGGGMLSKGPDVVSRYAYAAASPARLAHARAIETACVQHGVPLAAAALQFSLREPAIASTVVGVSLPERLPQTLELARFPIPQDVWDEIESLGIQTEDLEQ